MPKQADCEPLKAFLRRVPAVQEPVATGMSGRCWWVKFTIDIAHPKAWNVVQAFGYVLNYISVNERLPTSFKPVSPSPYLNGGPQQFLSWLIETTDPYFTPENAVEWLEGRLPRPVEDLSKWR
jgi:hypothetical protein